MKSNINATMHAWSSIYLGWMCVTNLQQVVSYFYYSTTSQQYDQMNGSPYLSDTCSGKRPTANCVPAPLITVHQLCMLNTEHIVPTVKCKFNSKKCYSVDCCFVLEWWVQCHVLCQQWCCACWSWWNTESYEACCCTGDTQLGSVNNAIGKIVGNILRICSDWIWKCYSIDLCWFIHKISRLLQL